MPTTTELEPSHSSTNINVKPDLSCKKVHHGYPAFRQSPLVQFKQKYQVHQNRGEDGQFLQALLRKGATMRFTCFPVVAYRSKILTTTNTTGNVCNCYAGFARGNCKRTTSVKMPLVPQLMQPPPPRCGNSAAEEAAGPCVYIAPERCWDANRQRHPAQLSGDKEDLLTNRSIKVMEEHVRMTNALKDQPLASPKSKARTCSSTVTVRMCDPWSRNVWGKSYLERKA